VVYSASHWAGQLDGENRSFAAMYDNIISRVQGVFLVEYEHCGNSSDQPEKCLQRAKTCIQVDYRAILVNIIGNATLFRPNISPFSQTIVNIFYNGSSQHNAHLLNYNLLISLKV
jgi:hypothetical protein